MPFNLHQNLNKNLTRSLINVVNYSTKPNKLLYNADANRTEFIKTVFENCTKCNENVSRQNIVVDYSSPNIAKPFHVGHLRSTIIGNFISNLHNYLNNNVTRINYLGDWGTQFGYMKIGTNLLNLNSEQIKQNPLKHLYEAYVHANKLAETDKSIAENARKAFTDLENGKTTDFDNWKNYMDFSVKELEKTYNRLGIKFDVYHYESSYNANNIRHVLDMLEKQQVMKEDEERRKYAMVNKRKAALVKSDGSTLYLTRDIAAVMDRFEQYKFNKMIYVVDNGQNDHFVALKSILQQMGFNWTDRLMHVKFGRVQGMSTRKGNVVFLKDILDEVRSLMQMNQINSPTTKAPVSDVATTDILGVSCVIINELKQRRRKDYVFSWDRALQIQGDTGVKLQYTHCRLHNLIELNTAPIATTCIPELLPEIEVTVLAQKLSEFNTVLEKAEEELESCNLVTYLFRLCNTINRAIKVLRVKDQENDIASQRLLVFSTSKEILNKGMTILGLKPLEKM